MLSMHKTFISYHHDKEQDLKNEIIATFGGDHFIDKSVNDGDINTEISDESIMRKIRQDYIADSTVTLVLIGEETYSRPFINSEIQASLWGDNPSGLLGVIRDELYDRIFGKSSCTHADCNCGISTRNKLDGYYNLLPYLIRENHRYSGGYHYYDTEVYCSLVKYSTFISNCEFYINESFNKRGKVDIAAKRNAESVQVIRKNNIFKNI
ncbi:MULTISPECIES: TIR domain-containing protein [Acinetobacter calcoaceticus/baumannii complex]|nr:TIR domain-containing protein [Acinetobacter nosocomialis]MBP1488968.1 TIR domain-containing protein [Acinetobacter nosocomialis]